jgi:hypothetical protein
MGEGHTRGEIERQLEREFVVDPARVRVEFAALIADLAREGLVDADPDG